MDPYIEAQAWRDFHTNFIVSLQGALMPQLAPKYFARIEEQIYIDEDLEEQQKRFPDIAIETARPEASHPGGGVALAPEPNLLTIPVPVEYRLPVAEVYAWKVGQPLPTIPIPLLREDPDVLLNLQEVYEQVYARARYDLQLDFNPPLPEPLAR